LTLPAEEFGERLGGDRVRQDDRQAERQQGFAVALGEADETWRRPTQIYWGSRIPAAKPSTLVYLLCKYSGLE